jgi:hypothetical protein
MVELPLLMVWTLGLLLLLQRPLVVGLLLLLVVVVVAISCLLVLSGILSTLPAVLVVLVSVATPYLQAVLLGALVIHIPEWKMVGWGGEYGRRGA